MNRVFPRFEWQRRDPEDVGMSTEKLKRFARWMHDLAGSKPFRVAVVRDGYMIAEWNHGLTPDATISLTSASKSAYSCLLGIAIADRKIKGIDDNVVDYYPDMMEVKDGEGPKIGRYAFEANRYITFRQLIGNTSGYMKPGERPGERFHYQTFGMNVLSNALGKIYGLYDSNRPRRLPGCAKLLEIKIREKIDGQWNHAYYDFEYGTGASAKSGIFGHGLHILANARDAARLGYLWLNVGKWDSIDVVPEFYLRQATRTNPDILNNEPEDNWKYGYGFWVNEYNKLWPGLPRDSYGAWGGGAKYIWVCPTLNIVVALIPGPWDAVRSEPERLPLERAALGRILDAVVR